MPNQPTYVRLLYTALSDLTIAPPFIPPIAKIGAEVWRSYFSVLKFGGVLSALGQLGVLAHVDFGLRRGVSAVCNARASYFVVDFGLRRGVSAGRNARASYFVVDFGLRRGVSAGRNARTIFYFAGISGNLWLLTRQKGEFFLLRIFRIRAILFLC